MIKKCVLFLVVLFLALSECVHDASLANHTLSFLKRPVASGRKLQQTQQIAPIRIFLDTSLLLPEHPLNTLIMRINQIAATFFQNLIKVRPLPSNIFFPEDSPTACVRTPIPSQYIQNDQNQGVDADLGILVSAQGINGINPQAVAEARACTLDDQTKRPIWGAIKYSLTKIAQYYRKTITRQEFQTLNYVAIHQFIHILGFSSDLYQYYQTSDFIYNKNDPFQIRSSLISNYILKRYNCSEQLYDVLEDYNGGFSHWQKHLLGSQLMISETSTQSYISELTLILLNLTGWYPQLNTSFVEPSVWGKDHGCPFVRKQRCDYQQFCDISQQQKKFGCNWQAFGIGSCKRDRRINGNCSIISPNKNNLCLNKNSLQQRGYRIDAAEKLGKYSKCFSGDIRRSGTRSLKVYARCYPSLCLKNGRYLSIKIQKDIFLCFYPGYIIKTPQGFDGNLQCPKSFDNICQSKKSCAFSCGNKGVCINGFCMCNDEKQLRPSCEEEQAPKSRLLQEKRMLRVQQAMKCNEGYIFDPISSICESCLELLGCQSCNKLGCLQ